MHNLTKLLTENFGGVTTENTPSLEHLVGHPLTDDQMFQISNEGLLDVVKTFGGDVKRNFTQGRKRNIKVNSIWGTDYDKKINTINLLYTNPNWLSKRRFIDGEIKGDDISQFFVRGIRGDVDFSVEAIQEQIGYIDRYAKNYITRLNEYIKNTQPLAERIRRGPLTAELYAEVFEHVNNNGKFYIGDKFQFPFGNNYLENGRLKYPTVMAHKKLPALTQDEIIETAEKVIMLLKYVGDVLSTIDNTINLAPMFNFVGDERWKGWSEIEKMENGTLGLGKHLDDLGNQSTDPLHRLLLKVGASAITDQELAVGWHEMLPHFDADDTWLRNSILPFISRLLDSANALSKWIDRSIR